MRINLNDSELTLPLPIDELALQKQTTIVLHEYTVRDDTASPSPAKDLDFMLLHSSLAPVNSSALRYRDTITRVVNAVKPRIIHHPMCWHEQSASMSQHQPRLASAALVAPTVLANYGYMYLQDCYRSPTEYRLLLSLISLH